MTEARFNELFERFIDRTIDEGESRELLDAFADDAALKDRFMDDLRTAHALIGLSLAGDLESTICREVIEGLRHADADGDVADKVIAQLRAARRPLLLAQSVKIAVGLAAAASIVLVFLVRSPRENSAPFATITHLAEVQWEGKEMAEGVSLGKERLRLKSGIARLDFAKGVRVTLEGPADFELLGPEETRLHFGNLTAHVPPAGIGFQVHTSQARVVDLGTTFGVSVGADGATDVSVFEGRVEVTSQDDKESQIVLEGDTVSFTGEAKAPTHSKFRFRSFKGWPVLYGVLNTGGNIRFVRPQPISNFGAITDPGHIVIFPEKTDRPIRNGFEANITDPGTYHHAAFHNRVELVQPPAGAVSTYLIQFNPPHDADASVADRESFTGAVTFDQPILAVLVRRAQLEASDRLLGRMGFQYPDRPGRGLEHGDTVALSEDRRTLSLDWRVMQALRHGSDQIRVVVGNADTATQAHRDGR